MCKFGEIINSQKTNVIKSSTGQFVWAQYELSDNDYLMFQMKFG